ncbi:MAG: right-handed parallel beta-helix repeat-containing protein, partial [Nitrosospira sp.]|nr:right-handed parallel beta-helix repeat-containing protein [Nitrosospira sp.]
VDGDALPVAHHPNVGHDPQSPDSVYFRIGANSSPDAGGSSNYLKIDSDLSFPNGGEITPGQTVHIRSASWRLDSRKITRFDGEAIFFDEPSRYFPSKGYGYYLTGSLWMLDEPGEWYYDTSKQMFHVWMPDDQEPGKRISLSVLAAGVDLNARSNVAIDGLVIRRTGVGILMVNSAGITVRNSLVSDTAREGIDITGASAGTIHANRIAKTGLDAISRKTAYPTGMTITDNVVSQSAVTTLPNGQRSLPVHSVQAIPSGINGTVSGNLITQTAYNGIYVDRGSRVFSNLVQESCLLLDDCAGIYTYGSDNNSVISRNLILNIVGNNNGTARIVHTAGIYLDEPSSGNTVSGNTVAFAEYGIFLHNAYHNVVESNTLFGNRTYQLWLQESTNHIHPNGDIYGNKIYSNQIFPTGTSLGVSQDTGYSTTADFATYDFNLYSTLTTRYVSKEKWASGSILHTLESWQTAKDNGIARNLDPNGRQVAQTGYTSFEVAGPNIIRNGDFSTQPLQWQAWNELEPRAQTNVESDGTRYWLKLVAGGSSSLVASQNFSVLEGQWYRLAFDMKTGKDNQRVVIAPRRGGGGDNGFELITDAEHPVYGGTSWKRYNVLFKSNKTVNYHDPATGDWGARIDFQHVRPGDYIELAQVELVPLRSVGITLREALLSNPASRKTAFDCPDSDLAAEACPYYVRFTDGQPITWPYELPAFGSEIIYTRNDSLVDTDSDGIADQQDRFPETPTGNPTNSQGCALGQDPQS